MSKRKTNISGSFPELLYDSLTTEHVILKNKEMRRVLTLHPIEICHCDLNRI